MVSSIDPAANGTGLAAALERGALLVPLADLGPLRVTGPDRIDFVHGQVSNDIRGLPEDGATRTLLLDHRGHALAEMTAVRRRDDLYLAVEGGAGDRVEQALRDHIVFDQVDLETLGDRLGAYSVQGARAAGIVAKVLGAAPETPERSLHLPFGSGRVLVVARDRSGIAGVDLHLLDRDAEALTAALVAAGARPATQGLLEPYRIAAGLASAASEAGPGVLPQEAGLEPLVSYRKGCYLGQEIMARIEARGRLRRGLVGLRLAGPPEGRSIVDPERDREVGRLGAAAAHPRFGWIALAVLRTDLPDDADLRIGTVAARRVDLPIAD